MENFALQVQPEFLECALKLPKAIKAKLIKCLNLLARDFRHPSLQCKKVKGAKASVYECRVDQSIRLIYDIYNNVLRCWYVGEHDSALSYATSNFALSVDDIEFTKEPEILNILYNYLNDQIIAVSFLDLDINLLTSKIDM